MQGLSYLIKPYLQELESFLLLIKLLSLCLCLSLCHLMHIS